MLIWINRRLSINPSGLMKLLQKLIYLLFFMLISNISMASVVSTISCDMMMSNDMHANMDASSHHSPDPNMDSMEEMAHQLSMDSSAMSDCCSGTECPMTSCASPTLPTSSTINYSSTSTAHWVFVQYQDLPLLLVISPHYRPPISTLS